VTTRDSLRQLLDQLTDDEVEALARIAREHGLPTTAAIASAGMPAAFIDARQYPILAAVWDNDDDAIFDGL